MARNDPEMMDTFDLFDHSVMPTYGRLPVALARGQGTKVWDENGREYLDFTTGIAVCGLGHCHPAMVRAVEEQARTLWHVSNLYYVRQQGALAAKLVDEVVGLPGKVFFSNSGAEANDGLIKAARRYGRARPAADGTPRGLVLTFRQSFHGRTLGGIAATGQDKVKEGFDPLLPGFRHLPFNDPAALDAAVDDPAVVAVMVEPVQGEGGVNLADPGFLRHLATRCRERDLLLFFDEVQCGIGRCGDWCGWRAVLGGDDPEVRPDGISWAKGMGGGFPIGAFWLGDRCDGVNLPLHDLLGPGSHGSTYGGSPLACAVSLAVLTEIAEAGLCARAVELGRRITTKISGWGLPAVTAVRGLGLLIGVVLDEAAINNRTDLPPAPTPALRVVRACLQHGLLVPPAGPGVVRLLPPLNVTPAEADAGIEILRRVLVGDLP